MFKLQTFIVEDSPVILENLVATLEELVDVEVLGTADDEAGALAGWRQHEARLDLVIVDIFLKSGSGLGLLAEASRQGLKGRRVVLTNYATPDIRRRCTALGADRVFDKSSDLEDLFAYCEVLAAEREAGQRKEG
jgi:DNA-binding NarL/FixJ family response regulator